MTGISDRLTSALADRYRIERELGQGGMAMVYLAHDLRHERKVAIKVLRPELADFGKIVVAVARARFHPEERVEAMRLLDQAASWPANERVSFTVLAGMYARLGERETALKTLERAEAAHEERLILVLKAWPALASLHDEPRYRAIVRRMGLPQ
jgi:serine/threonine protein kinase